MPTSTPMPTKAVGDIFTTTLWNSYLRDNLNKLLNSGHRTLTVAQFTALAAPEGTKGVVAGDEVYLEVDATAGVLWHLVYESGETTYKWRYLGGPPLYSEVVAAEGTTSATYAALTTGGPSLAIPRAGDYDVELQAQMNATVSANTNMSYDIGGTGAVDVDSIANTVSNGGGGANITSTKSRRKTALTSVTLTSKYKTSVGTGSFNGRVMKLLPVRIRHDA